MSWSHDVNNKTVEWDQKEANHSHHSSVRLQILFLEKDGERDGDEEEDGDEVKENELASY